MYLNEIIDKIQNAKMKTVRRYFIERHLHKQLFRRWITQSIHQTENSNYLIQSSHHTLYKLMLAQIKSQINSKIETQPEYTKQHRPKIRTTLRHTLHICAEVRKCVNGTQLNSARCRISWPTIAENAIRTGKPEWFRTFVPIHSAHTSPIELSFIFKCYPISR